jgi:excisionase family DNA binding protein
VAPRQNLSPKDRAPRRVRLDHRRRGYLFDGKLQEGFADREELTDAERLLVARWGSRFAPDRLSAAQRALLDGAPERLPSLAQRELRDNQLELRSPYMAGLYESLSAAQKRLVEEPGSSPEARGATYPLTVGDLSRLTGASDRQIRKWGDDGLLPSYRDGNQRRFYSAALIRAFAIARMSTQEKAVLSAAAHGKTGNLFQLIAATIGRAATRLPEEEAGQLASLAQELSSTSRLMIDVDRGDAVARMWESAHRSEAMPSRVWLPHCEKVEVAVHTEPREDGWANVIVGNTLAPSVHTTKAEAEAQGREIALRKCLVHVVHRRDGSVGTKHRYGSKLHG